MRKLFALLLVATMLPVALVSGESGALEGVTAPGQAPTGTTQSGGFCATELTPEQVQMEIDRLNSGWTIPHFKKTSNYYVPIAFHIVRHADGSGGLPPERLYEALHDLNAHFEQVGITFFRMRDMSGEYLTYFVDNDYYYYNSYMARNTLRLLDPVPDVINVWFAPTLEDACGTSSYTTSSIQGILVANFCDGNEDNHSTLAHEVGHYLDLYHTHETYFGVECPDSSNCETAGDLLCDTKADPDLTNNVANCTYVGPTAPPAGCGGTYDPDPANLMAYSPKNCRVMFTPMQIDKMIYTLTTFRANLMSYDATDTDGDGIPDVADICPTIANADQDDADLDGFGDQCDACPDSWLNDVDGDGICATIDNCPKTANADQLDADSSGIGDICQCTDGVMQFGGDNAGDQFGWRARGAGDVNGDGYPDIVVGAINAETGTLINNGIVRVFSGHDGALLMEIDGEVSGAKLGFGIGGAGDVNNDGFDDIIVGAWDDSQSGSHSGRAYIFLGSAGPFPLQLHAGTDAYRIHIGAENDLLGTSVDGVGDIDHDGYDDYIIGACQYYGPSGGYVKAYSGQDGSELFTMSAEADYDRFGYSIRNAGDVNKDGTNDIVVGAFTNGAGGNSAGRVYVFSGVDGSIIHTFTGENPGGYLGTMVSGAGDVNNDGYADIIAGAPYDDIGATNTGSVYVYSGFDGSTLWSFHGENQNEMMGWSVSGIGDMNLDGYDDFVIGAPRADILTDYAGWVYTFSGQDGTILNVVKGNYAVDWFGRDAYGMSDINQDGVNDLIVGAFYYNGESVNEGRAYVYYMGDNDNDSLMAGCDNCPTKYNPDQTDSDLDGVGDVCLSCCGTYTAGFTGNTDCSTDGEITLSDITSLIDRVYISHVELCCEENGNADGSEDGQLTLSDITRVIDNVYISHGPTEPCQ